MNKYEPPNLTLSPKGRKTVALVAWRHGCAAAASARDAAAPFVLIEQGHVSSRLRRACADGLGKRQGCCGGLSFRQPQAESLSACDCRALSEHQLQKFT
jgi:hypothetical protein